MPTNPAPCTVPSPPSAAPTLQRITPDVLRRARNSSRATQLATSGRERGLCLIDNRFECRRLADCEVGEHLAVERDPGFAEAGNKSTVGEAKLAHRRIEALDPQRTERAFAALAVAKGVLVRLFDRLLGDPDRVLAPAVVALGGFEDLFVLGVSGNASFDAGHG